MVRHLEERVCETEDDIYKMQKQVELLDERINALQDIVDAIEQGIFR